MEPQKTIMKKNKIWYGYAFLWICFICLLMYLSTYLPKDENLQRVEQGKMSIVNYCGHSYIVWSVNLGGGMCHNPDCECRLEKK